MPDARGLPQTQDEMRTYLQTALPLEDSCLIAMVRPTDSVARQAFPRKGDILAQAAKVLSIVWVDIQNQPGLADLGRVHQSEGSGEAQFAWIYLQEQRPTSIFLLDVQMRKPVREAFHVPFRVEEWLMLLETISKHGEIWFVPGPALDWQPMLQAMGPEAFTRVVQERCGSGVMLTLDPSTMRELAEHVRTWRACFSHLT